MATQKMSSVSEYIKKIGAMELMLKDIKKGLMRFESELEKSIKKGERDIKAGRGTRCKTKSDLDRFFETI